MSAPDTVAELRLLSNLAGRLNVLYRNVVRPLRSRAPHLSLCARLRVFRQKRLLDLFGASIEARRAAVAAGGANATPQSAWPLLCRLLGPGGSPRPCGTGRRGAAGLARGLARAASALPDLLQREARGDCAAIARGLLAPPPEHPAVDGRRHRGGELREALELLRFLEAPSASPRPWPELPGGPNASGPFAECGLARAASGAALGGEARDVTGHWVETAGPVVLASELERLGLASYHLVRAVPAPALQTGGADPCQARGLLYDPTKCLAEHWRATGVTWRELEVVVSHEAGPRGEMVVHHSDQVTGRSADAQVRDVAGDPQWSGGGHGLPNPFVIPSAAGASAVAMLLRGLPYSPDILFLHPGVLTCKALPLIDLRVMMPKVLYVPINPWLPPPVKVVTMPLVEADAANSDAPGMPWLAHCSLEGTLAVLEKHTPGKYALLHVEHAFAVFVLRGVVSRTKLCDVQADGSGCPWRRSRTQSQPSADTDEQEDQAERVWRAWHTGWFCSSAARHFGGLEAALGAEALGLGDPQASDMKRQDLAERILLPLVPKSAHHQVLADLSSTASEDPSVSPLRSPAFPAEAWLPWVTGLTFYNGSAWWWNRSALSQDSIHLRLKHSGLVLLGNRSERGRWGVLTNGSLWVSLHSQEYIFRRVGAETLQLESRNAELSFMTLVAAKSPQQGGPRNYLASEQVHEVPGLRWLLGDRGRCVEGFCECFPPFRGASCDLVDEGHPRPRVKDAVIWYLAHAKRDDMADLCTSLELLWRHYNAWHDYPVVIFHEGLGSPSLRQVLRASANRVWFARLSQEEFRPAPPAGAAGPAEPLGALPWRSLRGATGGWNHHGLGYRAVSRWQAGMAFHHPVLARASYAMYLDTDAYFPGHVEHDPIAELRDRGGVYACSPVFGHIPPGRENRLWEASVLYMHLRHRDPRGSSLLRHVADEELQFKGSTSFVDFHVAMPKFFRDPAGYGDYLAFIDSLWGWWDHAWYSTLAVTLGVAIWAKDWEVLLLQSPYAHQISCTCGGSAGGTQCVHHADGPLSMSYWNPTRRASRGLWLCWSEEQMLAFERAGGNCTEDDLAPFCKTGP